MLFLLGSERCRRSHRDLALGLERVKSCNECRPSLLVQPLGCIGKNLVRPRLILRHCNEAVLFGQLDLKRIQFNLCGDIGLRQLLIALGDKQLFSLGLELLSKRTHRLGDLIAGQNHRCALDAAGPGEPLRPLECRYNCH